MFDYGLDEAQEERARHLHAESIIIDMLFQGPISTPVYTSEMEGEIKSRFEKHCDIERSFEEAIMQPICLAVKDEFPQFREFNNITRGLVARGYSNEEIKGILGENWLRVIDQVW